MKPTVPPTATPGPSSAYITNGSRSSGKVALTFDFGGETGPALAIVDYLVTHEVHATVFFKGQTLTTDPGIQVMAVVCAHLDLFTIGNHSYTHPHFDQIPLSQIQTELAQTEAIEKALCPAASPRPFFRPPFGSVGRWGTAQFKSIMAAIGAAGYAKTIMWDLDTLDWSGLTGAQILDRVEGRVSGVAGVRAGSIVLMHLGGAHTLEALPGILAYVDSKGLTPVGLRDLPGI